MAFCGASVGAQPYMESGLTRHRFAQTTVGMDARIFAIGDATADGTLQDARLIIGGTHFWGHADLFIAIPYGWSGSTGFKSGVETGARIYPWPIERDRIRPFIGASLQGTKYREVGGPMQTRYVVPLSAGLTYQRNNTLISLTGAYIDHQSTYVTSPSVVVPIRMHPASFGLGVTHSFDATLSAEEGWVSGRTEARTVQLRAQGKLDAWTVSAGPSVAFFTKASSQLRDVGYAGQHEQTGIFPEVGVGRYFAAPDAQANLALRRMVSVVDGHGFRQTATRTAITAEWFFFLFDWHGFVPFLGPNIGQEYLEVRQDRRWQESRVNVGVTAGWDIRPDHLQVFTLRTAMRYSPRLFLRTEGFRGVSFEQFEVNFIQVVLYPGRMR